MDGWYIDADSRQQKIAFLTPEQAEMYGGYVNASVALGVNFIRPPLFIDEHWRDLPAHTSEVGHA